MMLSVSFVSLLFLLPLSSSLDVAGSRGHCHVKSEECPPNKFKCFDGECIAKEYYCNNKQDCPDRSDERYCQSSSSCPSQLKKCGNTNKCIPETWVCDRTNDCTNKEDEKNCDFSTPRTYMDYIYSVVRVDGYLERTKEAMVTGTLSVAVQKLAVAKYFSDSTFSQANNTERKDMALHTSTRFLTLLNSTGLGKISSSEIASFVNSFLVTCIDPRSFYSVDLISELRRRVDSKNYTNPYVYLTLCNAGDFITEEDVTRLTSVFWSNRQKQRTGTQAMIIMALACAMEQSNTVVNSSLLLSLTEEIKRKQYANGTVENFQTTALVMQALYASQQQKDPDSFDEGKALRQLYRAQEKDPSFGSFLNAYYVLPVFRCSSLASISSKHCPPAPRMGDPLGQNLAHLKGPKIQVKYSLRIGDEKYLEKTLSLTVPARISFYKVMDIASDVDDHYRFEYIVRDRKPYITAIGGVENDPESGIFWFPYTLKGNKTTLVETPADVFPKENDHLLMWYQRGS